MLGVMLGVRNFMSNFLIDRGATYVREIEMQIWGNEGFWSRPGRFGVSRVLLLDGFYDYGQKFGGLE